MKNLPSSWFRLRNVVLALVALLAFGGLAAYFLAPPPRPSYLTAPVTKADLEEAVLATGTVQAYKQVNVGAQVSGQIKRLAVKLGDKVVAGDLIAEIDSLTQQNTLRNAEAALQNTQAQLAAKQATLKQAEFAFQRAEQLLQQDAGSRESFEASEATLNATRAEIRALEAQIAQGRISVDTARLNLGYTRIVAPMAGTVVALINQEGQTVNANQSTPTIIKLARMDTVTIKAQISEADVTRVKPGQKVYFTILGEPRKRYSSTLRALEPAPDSISTDSTTSSTTSTTSTSTAIYYNGLLDVPNPDDKLRISMTTQVRVLLAEAKEALSIPAVALGERLRPDSPARAPKAGHPPSDIPPGEPSRERNGPATEQAEAPSALYSVRVLGKDGQPEMRQVKIGINNKTNAQVLEGLSEGEQVILGEATADTPTSTTRRRMGPPPM
ncbi:efflux RND transporter periplasmic adaptor subunit [Uliginosibacterium sp. 31-12]|uniref:efflux RND transporter periplasmic adaptor subunit n=1 Tax=Uliginosibacterium sp. 31-12 TaxID=3062781 RepID=UPI0026E3D0FD|nr:efflux RND transporter periplasmic adaptor subunit [Uliginosibacterium sp. 31-12]MDO6386673.1 efflux RND transporter periplasmic adaptor subunit [Uliginosibacterium sp. 31-12]